MRARGLVKFLSTCILIAGPIRAHPAGIGLEVRTENNQTVFHIGEVIRLELSFSASGPGFQINTANYDRSGRLGIEEYEIEPQSGWDDPLKEHFSSLVEGGGLFSTLPLSATPFLIHRELNEWVRFKQPGRYRLVVKSVRAGSVNYQADEPVRSNELWITIIPATQEWQSETFAQAVKVLTTRMPPSDSFHLDDERNRAAALLRYLDTPAAAKEMAFRLNDPEQFQYTLGLAALSDRNVALQALDNAFNSPSAATNVLFLQTMLEVSGIRPQPELKAQQTAYAKIIDHLLALLENKKGEAQVVSAFTIAQEVAGQHLSLDNNSTRKLTQYLAAGFDLLPVESQIDLLELRWSALDPDVMLPLLPKVAAVYKDGPALNELGVWETNHESAVALNHWWGIDPAGARLAILAEIARPRPRFGARELGILPDEELPEMDGLLADHLLIKNGHPEIVASLIARYATLSLESRVLSFLEEGAGGRCDTQASLLSYLRRVDPPAGASRVERALSVRQQTGCYRTLLTDIAFTPITPTDVAATTNDPLLQDLAFGNLNDGDPDVVIDAVRYLALHANASAESALWARLSAMGEERSNAPDTPARIGSPQPPQDRIKDELILAIATGQGWLANEAKLNRLMSLASNDEQRMRITNYLENWRSKQIQGMGPVIRAAQYDEPSLSALSEKLKQFPAGTEFVFLGDLSDEHERNLFAKLKTAAVSTGIKLSAQDTNPN